MSPDEKIVFHWQRPFLYPELRIDRFFFSSASAIFLNLLTKFQSFSDPARKFSNSIHDLCIFRVIRTFAFDIAICSNSFLFPTRSSFNWWTSRSEKQLIPNDLMIYHVYDHVGIWFMMWSWSISFLFFFFWKKKKVYFFLRARRDDNALISQRRSFRYRSFFFCIV